MISRKATLRQRVRLFDQPNIAAAIRSANDWVRVHAVVAVFLVAGIWALLPHIVPKRELSVNEFAAMNIAALGILGVIAILHSLRGRSCAPVVQRSLDEARAITLCVLDAMNEAVLLTDIHQDEAPLIYVNRAFERITGYSADEAIGTNCRYLQGSDRLQPEISEIRDAIKNRRMARVTLRNYRKDGS